MTKGKVKYATRTEDAVKQALLALLAKKQLADITVSELSREAHVSRSTFYEHFGNPADVYDAVVHDYASDTLPLMSQVMCSDGFKPKGRPFCSLVREAGVYGPVVREDRFLDAFMNKREGRDQHDLFALLSNAGYTKAQAEAICSFQMAGCFAAARSSTAGGEEWAQIRAVIDRFILGGIAACLAAQQNG
uniref:Transcriptional regulator n=1 Tax=uncultured bacterium Contig1491 TaxID=1393439 RepID=W0FN38_9BACT|nr:transcriptional regulator [uncultured bacterium Contig1491]